MDIRYIVTRKSDDGTFQVGDHLFYRIDGSISCMEDKGWIAAENVPEATKGMESVVDTDWEERETKRLYSISEMK